MTTDALDALYGRLAATRDRLERLRDGAAIDLDATRTPGGPDRERARSLARLEGKVEGVRLALGYVDEARRAPEVPWVVTLFDVDLSADDRRLLADLARLVEAIEATPRPPVEPVPPAGPSTGANR